MNHTKSQQLMAEAVKVIPGGVNSPVRAFKSVGGGPIFYDRAKGSRVWDADGNEYIDFVGSWGPMILGHTPDSVLDAVRAQLSKGTSFGAPTELEVRMAETLVEVVPSIEMVRMVSSGTEATMSAIRLARGFTGRDKFVKFDGNYHGHSDALLVAAGSGLITLGIPSTPGVTPYSSWAPPSATLNPVMTSSKMSRAPNSSHTARSPSRNPATGGTTPMLPETGSTMIAAMRSPCSSNMARTAATSLYGSTIVSPAAPAVTPGVDGMPSVTRPEPAAHSSASECPW